MRQHKFQSLGSQELLHECYIYHSKFYIHKVKHMAKNVINLFRYKKQKLKQTDP